MRKNLICGRQVDAVLLAEVLDDVGRQFLGVEGDAYGFEDALARLEESVEGAIGYTGQLCQLGL